MKSLARTPLGICLLLGVIASGCALTTAHVDLAYLPEPEKKSPLATISPMKIALEVEDQRPADERTWVGNKRNGYGAVTAYVQSNNDVTAVIRDAVTKELVNNGHTVVHPKDAPSDAGISVGLKRYWSDARMHFWDIEMIGTLQADVSIRDPKKNMADLLKPIVSTFRESRQIATDGAHASVLNGALAEFVRSFARDPGIIKTLKVASAQKEESEADKSPE